MKKMAELQLSIVSDPKNRKAIENQVLETIFLREHIYHYFLLWSLFVLSRPESNCLGHSWRSGCNYCQVSTAIQSSAEGRLPKAEHQTGLFYEHKAIYFLFCENVINFHSLMLIISSCYIAYHRIYSMFCE